jgi:hypothetical protein
VDADIEHDASEDDDKDVKDDEEDVVIDDNENQGGDVKCHDRCLKISIKSAKWFGGCPELKIQLFWPKSYQNPTISGQIVRFPTIVRQIRPYCHH